VNMPLRTLPVVIACSAAVVPVHRLHAFNGSAAQISNGGQSSQSPSLAGDWLGAIHDGKQSLHLRLKMESGSNAQWKCTLYSLDQGNQPIPCANEKLEGKLFSFDVPLVKGHWSGQVAGDGKGLTGTWRQTMTRPLNFTKQAALP
jgi:hypothetical protein